MKDLCLLAVAGLLLACTGCTDQPDNCDLDSSFAQQDVLVNCVEDDAATGQFTCTCPDDTTFTSSGACDKDANEQSNLIDQACPVPTSDSP